MVMAEMAFGIAFLIIVVLFLFQALELTFILPNGTIAPGFFPTIISVILIGLTLYYLADVIINRKKTDKTESSYSKESILLQVFIIGALGLSLFIAKIFGMLTTLGIFLFVSLVIVEKLSWIRSFIFSVSIMICLYLIFVVWIGMRLPNGIFG